MDQFDVSGLSPEELQQLTIHSIQMSEQCVEAINKLQDVVQMLIDKVAGMDEEVDKLGKVVMDEIIGGVNELYEGNQKNKSIEDMKGQYGSLFDPHMDAIGEMYPGLDIWEELHKEKGNYPDDEAFGGRVQDIVGQLTSKLDKIRGVKAPAAEEAMEPPEEKAMEEAAPELEQEEEDPYVVAAKKLKNKF